jgi:hypothetical protein
MREMSLADEAFTAMVTPVKDVRGELCGVIVTAMVALTTRTPDARETFDGHLARVASRSLSTPRAAAATS